MDTNMTGYSWFSKIFASLCFGQKGPQNWNGKAGFLKQVSKLTRNMRKENDSIQYHYKSFSSSYNI